MDRTKSAAAIPSSSASRIPASRARAAEAALRAAAAGTQTTFHGYLAEAEVNRIVGAASAAILPAGEDFGLVPLEAAAAGRQVDHLGIWDATASATVGQVVLHDVTLPYDVLNLTLSQIGINTVGIPLFNAS